MRTMCCVFFRSRFGSVIRHSIVLFVVVMGLASDGHAQLRTEPVLIHGFMLGIEGGYGWHKQSGEFSGPCGCAAEEGATGSGFIGVLSLEMPIVEGLSIGMRTGLDYKNASSSQQRIETVLVRDPRGPDTSSGAMSIPITQVGSYQLTYLFVAPYIRYQLIEAGAFVQVGPSISSLVFNHVNETRQILGPVITTSGEDIADPRFLSTGTRQEVIEDGEISDVNSTRISALISAGWSITLPGFTIAPMVTYDFPLTTIRDKNATDWKVSSVYAAIALKFGLYSVDETVRHNRLLAPNTRNNRDNFASWPNGMAAASGAVGSRFES